ncbi:DNA-binding transcriptional LysR family regulator [Ereboglobus sp. PH5-5]|uniref:LysR family transcriptional regulator n=1 Tax=unclassified Ereboglobus TaxID=2626932 RepID=UPI0024051712|nr:MULTISPECIES: LysR family transcriptional regulator [unclassified Ereboglobus]MDF9828503.1 DNA-binding transcriptional LysR family regulator [Ereboglobus sp. PH5-10]MDF9834361.1 DNA-binding transcriptional LysR family regulator [Ereboglobus sp. PH5-5]
MPAEYQFPYDLRHLVYFLEVARRLHFRKAAEALNVAQPALSRQIAHLEEALGAKLFARTRRRVELTPAGRAFAARIEPVLRSLNAAGRELRSLAAGETGHVRVAFTGLAMATVLPDILREFNRRYPGIRLELNEMPTSAQLAALQVGELGCGFFHPNTSGAPSPGIRTHMLLRERNGILLPAGHALGKKKLLRLRDLAAVPFVLFPRANNPGFYDRIIAACSQAGVTPKIVEEVWPRANGIGLVRAGIGVTFITPSEAGPLPKDVVFHALTGHAPESRLVLGWKQPPAPDPALAAFLDAAMGGGKK